MGVEGVVIFAATEVEDMRRLHQPPCAKENYDLDGEGLVSVVAVGVAGAAACLGFESVSAVPLVSSSSSERMSLSAREGGANLAVPIGTSTSCKCKRKH